MTHDTAKRALNNCAPDSAVRKALQYQEGRLFKPLAFTKTFSMMIAAVLAITLDPAIRLLFMRMREFRIRAEVDCLDRNRGDGWKVSQRGKSPDLLGYNMNVAVWVGLIALLGVDAETGVFMLLYLELAYEQRKRSGQMRTRADLRAAIEDGAVKRLRPR